MSERSAGLEQAFAALAPATPAASKPSSPRTGSGSASRAAASRARRRSHRASGRRFTPTGFVEAVTDPGWEGTGQVYKVFTFREPDGRAVLLEDCRDRDDALAKLQA